MEKASFLERNPSYGYGDGDGENGLSGGDAPLSSAVAAAEAAAAAMSATSGATSFRRRIDSIREHEFSRLLHPMTASTPRKKVNGSRTDAGLVYLDHAGATLYGESQLRQAMEPLLAAVHGNPHSQVGPH